ncbi:hypothetical protein M0802_013160 [Mischocyttarus mexicanus]|nr:hypothetical protein M0802_013160 [Mischocyttarus mexicanus]
MSTVLLDNDDDDGSGGLTR